MSEEVIEVEFDEEIFLPVYRPLLECDSDIIFLWGGRDSGKSHFIAQRLIKKCLEADYFRCVLIKKTYDSIQDSQFQDIQEQVEEMGLSDFFTFTKKPLEIRCENGNKFIARGCDNPKKIKSIKNPTDAWFEEGDQITEEEHLVIWTGLRGPVKVQQWFSFNPEAENVTEPKDFWLCKNWVGFDYGKNHYSKTVKVEDKEVDITYTSWHTTLDDNPYCTPERKATHESYKESNPHYYKVYRHGHWGKKAVVSPFITTFKESHKSRIATFDPNKLLIPSIDFNLDPFCVTFHHIWTDNQGPHCHTFDQLKILGGSIDEMCDQLKAKYGPFLHNAIITGDYSGMKRDISQRDKANLYLQLQRKLNLHSRQFKVETNPTHKTSRSDCNYFFHHFPDYKVNPETCFDVVYDIENVEVDYTGKIIKSDRQKKEQQADMLDTIRYLINAFFKDWIVKHQKGYKLKG